MWIVGISKSKSGGNKRMYLLSSFCNALGLHDVGVCADGTTPIKTMWLHIAYIKAIDLCFTSLKIRNENK